MKGDRNNNSEMMMYYVEDCINMSHDWTHLAWRWGYHPDMWGKGGKAIVEGLGKGMMEKEKKRHSCGVGGR